MTSLENVPFNVLDLAWRDFGKSNSDAVRASVELARKAEDLGFRRYWFAEHHGLPVSASSTPAILIGAVAAATTTMRVGSGGIMLPNYAPLSVAEQFGTLKALYGDRIDLGIGRASGADGVTTLALRRTRAGLDASSYPRDLLDLIGFFRPDRSQQTSTPPLLAVPGLGDSPEIWLLGSSRFSAQLAGKLGLPFAFAHHFSSDRTEEALDLYRRAFIPSEFLEAPHSMISVMLVVDDSHDVVHAEMLPSAITFLHMLQGKKPEPVSVEAALAYDVSPRERELITQRNARQAIGTTDEVAARLRSLVASTGADELMFQLHGATASGRQRSLEIVTSLRTSQASTIRGEAS